MSPRNKLMLFVIEMDQLIGHNHTFLSDHAYEHENQTHRLLIMLNWSQGLTRTTPLWMIPPNTGSANKFWRPNNTSTVFWMQIWLQLSKPWHFSICRKKKKSPLAVQWISKNLTRTWPRNILPQNLHCYYFHDKTENANFVLTLMTI